ncbi:hypothetical protein T440DRAFT_512927 [Plenodomus tracheiphilus IPT5]|uniref:Uncharacterized protein n=1 Tax=Plenodomus tracheiphilus IPT5 TaxID=1408161 RepID=A0A6A7BNC4_9PLEO|nr:hypothetical protein T440DRAFT_512927 [Plenodomus tracheiphilus IPT5]
MSPNTPTAFNDFFCKEDLTFIHHFLKVAFQEDISWPKLKCLTLRSINFNGLEEELGMSLAAFKTKMLPGVDVYAIDGDCMFFEARSGTIINWQSADGLLPHLDPNENPYVSYSDCDDDPINDPDRYTC